MRRILSCEIYISSFLADKTYGKLVLSPMFPRFLSVSRVRLRQKRKKRVAEASTLSLSLSSRFTRRLFPLSWWSRRRTREAVAEFSGSSCSPSPPPLLPPCTFINLSVNEIGRKNYWTSLTTSWKLNRQIDPIRIQMLTSDNISICNCTSGRLYYRLNLVLAFFCGQIISRRVQNLNSHKYTQSLLVNILM